MRTVILPALTSLLATAQASTIPQARELFSFGSSIHVENLIFRPNGQLILDTFSNGTIFGLDPHAKNPVASVLGIVPDVTWLLGIVEISPDFYAANAGVGTPAFHVAEGTAQIVTIDLRKKNKLADVKVVAHLDGNVLPNGLVAVPWNRHVVLSSDSFTGRINRINTVTGAVDVILEDERLTAGANATIPAGVNGLKIFNDYLYFANTGRRFLGRIHIDRKGSVIGDLEIVYQIPANVPNAIDDFSLDRRGNVYAAFQPDSLVKISPRGELTFLLGNSTDIKLVTPTSTILSEDERTVFVATGGGAVVAYKLW